MSIHLYSLCEFKKRKVRKERIKDGKKVVKWEWEYEDVPNGYKVIDGKLVKMTQKERMNRSKAAKKSANKSTTKRKRTISMRRRSVLTKDK